jgi:dGTPase
VVAVRVAAAAVAVGVAPEAGAVPAAVVPQAADADLPVSGASSGSELSRADLESREEAHLHACAMRSATASRRIPIDPEGRTFDLRTEFQRDRDRIVHSRAFRRLRHKTQVYTTDGDDHARNRLIHTLEVAGIARTLARALALNEDLSEVLALGHDLGHAAFGLPGERVLHGILSGQIGIAGLDPEAARVGGFQHNHQGLRIVDILEKRYRHVGLNLTDPVREGILKAVSLDDRICYPDEVTEGLHTDLPPFLETQVVNLADAIATQVHDLDDGLHGGAVTMAEVERLEIVRRVMARVGPALARGRFLRISQVNRGIAHLLVTAAATHTATNMAAWVERMDVRDHAGFLALRAEVPADLVSLPPPVEAMHHELAGLVARRVINSYTVNRADERARRYMTELFSTYYRNPLLLEDHVLIRFREVSGVRFLRDCRPADATDEIRTRYHDNPIFVRLLADHLAAMTDTWALKEYERLGQ